MISNWAILRCRFADDADPEVWPTAHYLDLFTGSGAGSHNMTDYFRDVSHGQLDLSASQVFGWLSVPARKGDYEPTTPKPVAPAVNRDGLVAQCRQAAVDSAIDLSMFDGVVVSMNGAVDLFGYIGGMTAFCSSDNLEPSLLGQEMGHGYGLDHSRRQGSAEDYQDVFDTMSTASAHEASDPKWVHIGPALNAANMRSRGWFDATRLFKVGAGHLKTSITLRPVHRRDLPGNLAVELPAGELVEFRVPAGWDAGLPTACVLVHDFYDDHSYLLTSTSGKYFLEAGDEYQIGIDSGALLTLHVDSIDVNAEEAVVSVNYAFVPPALVPWPWPLRPPDGALSASSGLVLAGKFTPVPPRTPGSELLQPIETYFAVGGIADVSLRALVRRSALEELIAVAQQQLSLLQPIRVPASRPDNQ